LSCSISFPERTAARLTSTLIYTYYRYAEYSSRFFTVTVADSRGRSHAQFAPVAHSCPRCLRERERETERYRAHTYAHYRCKPDVDLISTARLCFSRRISGREPRGSSRNSFRSCSLTADNNGSSVDLLRSTQRSCTANSAPPQTSMRLCRCYAEAKSPIFDAGIMPPPSLSRSLSLALSLSLSSSIHTVLPFVVVSLISKVSCARARPRVLSVPFCTACSRHGERLPITRILITNVSHERVAFDPIQDTVLRFIVNRAPSSSLAILR